MRVEAGRPRLPAFAAVTAVAVGVVVLLGWSFDIPVLKAVIPGRATMKPNTAIAFIIVGIGLWTRGDAEQATRHSRLVRARARWPLRP